MLSTAARTALLDLRHRFINSGDEINLAHLLDLVNSTIPDKDCQDWKDWSSHMESLNEAWMLIHRENQQIPWPEVSIDCSLFRI
jgi:hypothetical protein